MCCLPLFVCYKFFSGGREKEDRLDIYILLVTIIACIVVYEWTFGLDLYRQSELVCQGIGDLDSPKYLLPYSFFLHSFNKFHNFSSFLLQNLQFSNMTCETFIIISFQDHTCQSNRIWFQYLQFYVILLYPKYWILRIW